MRDVGLDIEDYGLSWSRIWQIQNFQKSAIKDPLKTTFIKSFLFRWGRCSKKEEGSILGCHLAQREKTTPTWLLYVTLNAEVVELMENSY